MSVLVGLDLKPLQVFPQYDSLRQEIWNTEVSFRDKLYGMAADLQRTAEFVNRTGQEI